MSNLVALGDCTDRCLTWNPAVDDPDGEFDYIDLSSVDKDTKRIEGISPLACSDAPSRARQIVKAGDILVSTVRPNLNGVAIVPSELDGATASTGYTVLRPRSDRADGSYLFHWVKHPEFVSEMVRLATGASYPAVSDKIVRAAMIPLPPLPEQRRIAAILDKADALRTKRREAIAKLDQLLKSVFLEMFGDPVTNPKGWPMVKLGELGEWSSGGTPARLDAMNFKGDIPWYSSGELNSVYVGKSDECISPNAVKSSAAKIMRPGSLMVGMYDTAAFKSSFTTVPAACNQAIAFSYLNEEKCDSIYVYQVLQLGKEHFKRMQRGVRQKNLNLSLIRDTQIAHPPLAEQQEFSSRFRVIHAQIEVHMTFELTINGLFASLQQQAFTGAI